MEQVSHNIGDPLMKAIIKYKFHPSAVALKKNCSVRFLVSLRLNVKEKS